jgi:hypothetical protein
MGIGISTQIFDLQGAHYFRRAELDLQELNKNYRLTRRVSRTATLDGGTSIYDTGYAPGDRDITVKVPAASKAIADYLAYITKIYNQVLVATEESVFLGDPSSFFIDADGSANLIINIISDACAE